MDYIFEYKPYNRKLRKPLRAHYGEMWERQGFIIRLEDENGRVGYGDVAPFEYFGTESFEQAKRVLRSLRGGLFEPRIKNFPCVQFGLESAQWMLEGGMDTLGEGEFEVSALLSAGRVALDDINKYLEQGYRKFKWKIAVEQNELGILKELLQIAPFAKFRLDANGGLHEKDVWKWLESEQVEYIEQPLPPGEEETMMQFGERIALDESTLRVEDMEKVDVMGWKGFVVVKPSLMGSLDAFLRFRKGNEMKFTYSSSMDTIIGMAIGIALASQDQGEYSLGFGVQSYFEPGIFGQLPIKDGNIDIEDIKTMNFHTLWDQI